MLKLFSGQTCTRIHKACNFIVTEQKIIASAAIEWSKVTHCMHSTLVNLTFPEVHRESKKGVRLASQSDNYLFS